MEKIIIEGTQKTPAICFDADKGIIKIEGKSVPENTEKFYRPLLEWIVEYSKNPKSKTVVEITIEYYNTSSSKALVDMLMELDKMHSEGNEIVIKWFYEEDDDDICETGEEYKSIFNIPFEIIPIPVEE